MQRNTNSTTNSVERYEDQNFVDTSKPVWNYSLLYDDDVAYFQAGSHYSIYKNSGQNG
jgi:1,4-alpha-glucan branching enzyme